MNFWKKKYVGVQSWKAAHLSTLEIRVEQKRNRVKKERKLGEKRKIINAATTGNLGPVDNWSNVCFDKSGPHEDSV